MRNFTLPELTRGLNIVSPASKLRAGQLTRAENVVFTRNSVKRRRGRLAACLEGAGTSAVSFLKRFYRLATTGSITKYFIRAHGTTLEKMDSDWSDDTRAIINSFTALSLPNTANNSLYDEHEATSHTITSGAIQSGFSSKNWLYLIPQYDSTDDVDTGGTTYPKNAPIRTDGTKVYLMGLVPPAALALADTEDEALPAGMRWGTPVRLGGAAASSGLVKDPTRDRYWYAYKDSSTNNLMVNYYENGAVGTAVNTSGGTAVTGTQTIAMCVDYEGRPSVVWVENTTTDLKYTYRDRTGTTWTTETIDNTAWNGCAAIIDYENTVHVIAEVGTGTAPSYFTKSGDESTASWSAAEAVGASGGGDGCAIAVTSANIPLVAYHVSAGANRSVYYATRASGSWVETELDTNGGAGNLGHYPDIAVTNDDVPWVAYPDGSKTNMADFTTGSWVIEEADGDSGAGTTSRTRLAIGTLPKATLDAAIDPAYSDDQYPIIVSLNRIAIRDGTTPTWSAATVGQQLGFFAMNSVVILGDDEILVSTQGNSVADALVGTFSVYYYRLTAEYDDGVLGESMPSQATQVSLGFDIGINGSSVLDLDDAGGRYDMTDDVSKIHVYRTVRYGSAGGPYYFVGSATCSSGAPTADFTDTVTDTDLVANKILDEDKYLPPKFRRATFWKDRAVLANLKARLTDAAEGTELDLEGDGIHKNRLRFSVAFQPDLYRANFFQDILPDGDSGSIQQVIVNPRNDALYVFLENDVVALTDQLGDSVAALSFRPRNIANSHGTPAPFSVVEHEGFLFYWTKWGVEVIDATAARSLTNDTIGVLWNLQDANHPRYADRVNMAQVAKVRGVVHVDSEGERILWAYPAATSTFNTKILVLDFARWRDSGFQDDGVWSIWTGWPTSCFAVWDGEGDRGELFGGEADSTKSSWIYRLEIADVDQQGDSFAAVVTSAVAPAIVKHGLTDCGTEERLKRFGTVRVDGRIRSVASTAATTVAVAYDVNEAASPTTLDTVTWTQGTVQRRSRNFPHTAIGMYGGVQLTVTDATPASASLGAPPFELHAISYTVQDMTARTVRG